MTSPDSFQASRRAFVRRLVGAALAAGSLAASGVAAAQGRGRMDPGEREQLRRDLRERGGWARDGEGRGPGRGSEPPGRGRGNPDPGRGDPRRERLSENEREQLRRQLREQGRRRN